MGKILDFKPGNTEPVIQDEPAKVIDMEHNCIGCKHLLEVDDEGTCICNSRVHMNDTPIVPMVQGEYTSDWGFCGGEFYERQFDRASGQGRRGRDSY